MSARIGIDFGYKYSGIALLDENNNVLDGKVIQHRIDISDKLINRRNNRSMRRRNIAKRRRLRDFYALLTGMNLQPVNARPGEKMENAERVLPGNRLYALAHHRGWDYAEITELLVITQEGKAPQKTAIVKTIDSMLIQEYNAPALFEENTKRPSKMSDAEFKKFKDEAKAAFNERAQTKLDNKYMRFVRLKNEFLGELHSLEQQKHNNIKSMDKKNIDVAIKQELEEEIEVLSDKIEKIYSKLQSETSIKDNICEWLVERLDKVYENSLSEKKKDDIVKATMVYLGLDTAEELFKDGKVYRPHRNRHRSEMKKQMEELLNALFDGGDKLRAIFDEHFNFVVEKCKWKKAVAEKEKCWQEWQNAHKFLQTKAAANAKTRAEKEKREITPKDIYVFWQHAVNKIIEREYRKKRFDNRKVGKCPARIGGKACGKNLSRKNRAKIRELQFEIESRQMNVMDGDDKRNLNEMEIAALCGQVRFCDSPTEEDKLHNKEIIGKLKTPPVKNDARGKKESLTDIANGAQNGRAGFCVEHLTKKLELLRDDKTTSDEWANLHQERILSQADAPPSIRQKVERVVAETRKLLDKHKVSNIEHVGIETARFDISVLAEAEGKKSKKKTAREYQKSNRPANKAALAEQQGGLCFLCGEMLHRNIHTDHLAPQAKGGANVRKNLVAMHDYCNIDKNKHVLNRGQISAKALEHLRQNDPKKAAYLDKILEGGNLPQNTTAAPQHTMFGAKILRGQLLEELIKKFNLQENYAKGIIRRPRAADTVFLRESWFGFMHRQKGALRESKRILKDFVFEVDKSTDKPNKKVEIDKLKLSKYLFPPSDKKTIEGGDGWLRVENDFIIGEPKTDDVGGRFVYVCAGNKRVVLKFHITDKSADDEVHKSIKETSVGDEVEISLADICPPKWRKYKAQLDSTDWLQQDGNVLRGIVQFAKDKDGKQKKYVAWQKVIFTDEGEIMGEIKIHAQTARHRLRVVAAPSPDDKINMFHHLLDAAVLATNVDWDGLLRLRKDTDNLQYLERVKKRKQSAQEFAPNFDKWQLYDDKIKELRAPQNSDFVIVDKASKSGNYVSKYNTEPYRLRDNKKGEIIISQRMPLPNISRKNIDSIVSDTIQNAMKAVWDCIDKLPEEKKQVATITQGTNTFIAENYFLDLSRTHILHPHNTRSARCERKDGFGVKEFDKLPDNMRRDDKRDEAKRTHYFRRQENWAIVILFEDGGKQIAVRRKAKFYWRDKQTPEYDKPVPCGAKRIAEFRKGDLVQIDQTPGIWKIYKLGERAALLPNDSDAEKVKSEKSSSYTKLKVVKM